MLKVVGISFEGLLKAWLFHWTLTPVNSITSTHAISFVLSRFFPPFFARPVGSEIQACCFCPFRTGPSLPSVLPSPKPAMCTSLVTQQSTLMLAVDMSVLPLCPSNTLIFFLFFPHIFTGSYTKVALSTTLNYSGINAFLKNPPSFPMTITGVLPGMGGSDSFLILFY